jgi:hypothetical protein
MRWLLLANVNIESDGCAMISCCGIQYKEALIKTSFDISLQWSAVSRLFLVSSMIYSLKDAAERDRLSGSTFIQMNYMVAIWALVGELGLASWNETSASHPPNLESSLYVVSFFLSTVGIGQAVIPLGGLSFDRIEMVAFSLPFFIKGFKGQLKKAGKLKEKE